MHASKRIALLLALAAPALLHAQNLNLLEKYQFYFQTSAATPATPTLLYPYEFDAQTSTSAALSLPSGLSSVQLAANTGNGDYELVVFFANKSAMDAAYSNGTYAFTLAGQAPISLQLIGDLYTSVVPQVVSGGTWTNGVLVVDPTAAATLNFNTFTGYGSGNGSHQRFQMTPEAQGDSYNPKQEIVSIAVASAGLPATSSAFTSFTIPAGSMSAGNIYQCTLSYDNVGQLVQSSSQASVSLFATTTHFYVAAKPTISVPVPTITAQPVSLSAPLGSNVTFNVGVTYNGSSQPPSDAFFNWFANGSPVDFSNSGKYQFNVSSMTVKQVASTDAGPYALQIVTAGGLAATQIVNLTIVSQASQETPPIIQVQPSNQSGNNGTNATFTVTPTGVAPFTYQWSFNGVAISGATGQNYPVVVSSTTAGAYSVAVTNAGGTTTSNSVTLTLNQVPTPPAITRQPVSQTLTAGATVAFNIAASGYPAPTYQWYFATGSNTPAVISGATSSRYVVAGLTSANAGNYTCKATNGSGNVTSSAAALAVTNASSSAGHLVNLSMLSNISGSLSMGFVIGGTGTSGNENLLIRAVGPSIGPGTVFNVSGIMPDPTLTVVQQTNNAISFKNSGWAATSANQTAVTNADNATGAFGLTVTTSKDSALVESLPPVAGGYSATVNGASGDGGYALTEVYDDTAIYNTSLTRLLNLSCLTNIPAGGTIDVGFVIGGTTAKTVLIRASGPTLAVAPFNIGGTMADPQIVISASATPNSVISANAGWGGDTVLSGLAAGIGAFSFSSPTSLDSAAIVTLEPAVPYAVQVNSASGGGGTVLVEIYDLNP